MSVLKNLAGKGTRVKIKEWEFDLKPLGLDEMAEFADLQNKDQKKAMSYVVKASLKKSIPDCTDEEIEALSPESLGIIIQEVIKINGFESKKAVPE